ncbi:hypothetical protein E1B28_000432 [Marasmius oreades]|uniref:Uncharacterized protein n=1 Tax=Marasmius oreades TaxID=181124 RepID=A0A9P8AEG6_9AGAR|nr:uncharacterized protein E1B28_000432 [Marasmius oreades]KAG7098488.1 hypothetical protein E1B28_000432 [Marasmius oreades]
MSVRFGEDQVISPTNRQENTSGVVKPLPKPPQASFRLTPLAPLVQSGSSPPGSSAIDSPSFLDFDNAGSSNASRRTSNEHASSRGSRPQSTSFFSRPVGARSRWSTTTPSSHNQQESISSPSSQLSADLSSPSYSFPFPTSLPASPHHPEGHKPSPPIFPGVVPGAENNGSSRAEIHLSELNPISPVESVPMSISDLHFRQSESDDISENGFPRRLGFHLPPHPPLPAIPPTPTQPVTNTSGADPPASAPMSRGSLPLLFDSPTPVAPVTTRQTRTHTRSLSNDLLNSQSRRPLGPRVRDSHH